MERRPDGTLTFVPPVEVSPKRLETLGEVRQYIDALDLTPIKERLTCALDDGGRDWSRAQADYYEPVYRNWLFLRRKYEGESMPPHADMDELWHGHILDTYAYFEDCDRIFGYYFHHFPYFGMRGPEDHDNLLSAWQQTQNRYKQEFGDYIYDFDASLV